MRNNILNKTMKAEKIPDDLSTIRSRIDAVLGDYPMKKAELTRQLERDREVLSVAKAKQDAAEDLKDFDAAADDVRHAEMRVNFIENALRKLDAEPRMTEAEYNSIVNSCSQIMEESTAEYITKVSALMNQIKEAKDTYLSKAAAVNQALIDLDAAANVIQTKYTERIDQYSDGNGGTYEVSVPDPNEWRRHAVRYTPTDVCRLATTSEDHTILAAAWYAVSRAYPDRS